MKSDFCPIDIFRLTCLQLYLTILNATPAANARAIGFLLDQFASRFDEQCALRSGAEPDSNGRNTPLSPAVLRWSTRLFARERIPFLVPEETAEHLRLCREVYGQLRRIQTHQEHKGSVATVSLPINLSVFVREFDLYLKWAERNSKVVELAVRTPPIRVRGSGEIA